MLYYRKLSVAKPFKFLITFVILKNSFLVIRLYAYPNIDSISWSLSESFELMQSRPKKGHDVEQRENWMEEPSIIRGKGEGEKLTSIIERLMLIREP